MNSGIHHGFFVDDQEQVQKLDVFFFYFFFIHYNEYINSSTFGSSTSLIKNGTLNDWQLIKKYFNLNRHSWGLSGPERDASVISLESFHMKISVFWLFLTHIIVVWENIVITPGLDAYSHRLGEYVWGPIRPRSHDIWFLSFLFIFSNYFACFNGFKWYPGRFYSINVTEDKTLG